jgi:toxin-antitoxin system PIN domain toxin
VILPDANLLLHALNSDSANHVASRKWWRDLLEGGKEVGLCSVVVFAFVRISTHRMAFPHPLSVEAAFDHVENWLSFPSVSWIDSIREDIAVARDLLQSAGTGGNLVTDAQIAAIALRRGATIHTADSDFGRFPKVRWKNPLKP